VTTEGAASITVEVDDDPGDTTGEATLVTVGGDLEFGTAAPLRTTLSDLAQRGHDRVVVDLAGLRFIDSTGLSLLVQAKQRFEAEGRRLELRRPTERVTRVFETSGLAELLSSESGD